MKSPSRRLVVFLILLLLFLAAAVIVSTNTSSGEPDPLGESVTAPPARAVPATPEPEATPAPRRAAASEAPTSEVATRRRVHVGGAERRLARESKEAAAQEARAQELIAAEPMPSDPTAARLVPVVITFDSGGAPDLARIHYTGAGLIGSANWRPGRPVVELRPGKHRVWVAAGDLGKFKSALQWVEVAAGVRPTIRIRLRDEGAIVGRLVFPPGETVAWLPTVYLRSATADLFDGAHTFVALPGDFAFGFHDLPPGRYVISYARVGNRDPVATATVDVAGVAVRRDLRVPPLRRDEYVLVRVVGPDGEGIEDAVVHLGALGGSGIVQRRHAVVGGSGGTYKALLRGLVALKPGEQRAVLAITDAYGQRVEAIPPGEHPEVTVRMLDLAAVDVEVAPHGPSQDSATRFAVDLTSVNEIRRITRRPKHTFFAAEGTRVRLGGLQPGEHVVTVLVQRPDGHFVEVSRRAVSLASGSNAVVVSAPELHPVEVHIGQTKGSALLYREGDTDPWRLGFTDDGVIEFHGVPAGSYRVVLTDQQKRSFLVPTDSVVRF